MFESVLLPAPFSPSSACTSPTAASKSTPSFASTPGNRFVIPRMTTAAPFGAAVRVAASFTALLARRATDHALHEPVHSVEAVRSAREDLHRLALRNTQLPTLIVERAGEHVEAAVLHRLHLRGDLGLRRRTHVRPEWSELREAVREAAVVEAGLPRARHRFLDALRVVDAPVVERRGEPRLGRELLRVGVVADPRDALRLGELAGRGRVDILAEHVGARGDKALGGLL